MRRAIWRWFLPLAQLVLALACHIYGPHEYRARAQRDRAVNNPRYFYNHTPEVVERVSLGINFPALVLDYPLRDAEWPIYERNSDYTYIRISPRDFGFFFFIVPFWRWVGKRMDGSPWNRSGHAWSFPARLVGLALGIVFGILTGAYAYHFVAQEWIPWKQIGACGLAWSIGLIVYFALQLKRVWSTAGKA